MAKTMIHAGALPRLYESADDIGFDEEDEDTLPRASATETGIRSFFDRVVAELEDTQRRRFGT